MSKFKILSFYAFTNVYDIRQKLKFIKKECEDNNINDVGNIIKHLNHYTLYFLMLALPITGAIGWFRGIEAFANLHVMLKSAFLLLVALHLTSTFYQQVFLRNNVLRKMLLGRK